VESGDPFHPEPPPPGGGGEGAVVIPRDLSTWQAPQGFVPVGALFRQAWGLMAEQLGNFLLLGLVFFLVNGAVSSTGIGLLLYGPLIAGVYYSVQRGVNLGRFEVGDLFKGFSIFLPAMLAGLLIAVFGMVGFMLCILPLFLVQMMYKMTYLFMLDRQLDFWPAMEASRKLFFANFWKLTLLYIVEGCILFIGVCLCYVGIFLAFPLTVAMTTLAYRQLVGFQQTQDYEPQLPV
jgi:uncharacterized membrane protein